jgi:hypothetical protein
VELTKTEAWSVLSKIGDWGRHLAAEGLWLKEFARSVHKTHGKGRVSGFEALLSRSCGDLSEEEGTGMCEDVVRRFDQQVTRGRLDLALGTLWGVGLVYSKLTESKLDAPRDSMAMKIGHSVKALAVNRAVTEATHGERQLYAAYLVLHAQFLEHTRIKWIFFLSGYQPVLYRVLDERTPFDEVGSFAFTAACDVSRCQ